MFEDARLKVEWAEKHIDKLNAVLTESLKTELYTVVIKHDADAGTYMPVIENTASLPDEVPLLIGDAIHNLHTALDYTACGIIRQSGGNVDKYTKFPFKNSRQELVAAINGGQMQRAGAALIACIVDVVKPYSRGNLPLCALHDADIDDKHILLVPVVHVVQLRGLHWKGEDGKGYIGVFRVAGGDRLELPPGVANLEIIDHGEPTLDVFFGKGSPMESLPVVPALHNISEVVSGAIDAIEKTLSE